MLVLGFQNCHLARLLELRVPDIYTDNILETRGPGVKFFPANAAILQRTQVHSKNEIGKPRFWDSLLPDDIT